MTVLNTPGTIDSDYRGEVGVILINHGDKPFEIARGDRIAQLVVAPVDAGALDRSGRRFRQTNRGAGGFGSTGDSDEAACLNSLDDFFARGISRQL